MSIAEMELDNNRAVVAPRVKFGEHVEEARLVDRVEMMLRRGKSGEYNLARIDARAKAIDGF